MHTFHVIQNKWFCLLVVIITLKERLIRKNNGSEELSIDSLKQI